MRFSAVLALIAAATVVSAETNAERFARGLPPMPAKRASPIEAARRGLPSKIPGKPPGKPSGGECNTGSLHCCQSTAQCGDGSKTDQLLSLLGISATAGDLIGSQCSGVVGSSDCDQEPVCCNNNHFNGVIATGCSPVNVF